MFHQTFSVRLLLRSIAYKIVVQFADSSIHQRERFGTFQDSYSCYTLRIPGCSLLFVETPIVQESQ